MSLLQSILMGLIQGLTEFLPVSSSGHLALFKILLMLIQRQVCCLMLCSMWEPWWQSALCITKISFDW